MTRTASDRRPAEPGPPAPAHRRGRLLIALWLAFVLACAAVVMRTAFTADLSAFLPRAPTPEQRLLVDQLRDGLVSRLVLIGVEGGDAASRAELSRALAATLRADRRFAVVQNGEAVHRDRDSQLLLEHRYQLSPAVTPQRFTEAGLRAAIGDTLDLLGSSAGLFVKSLLPRDPTGEMTSLLSGYDGTQGAAIRDGVWASRDGQRAVLLAQTAAPGADIDAQAAAMAAIDKAFDTAAAQVAHARGIGAADFRLRMTGPGVISVQTRDTIRQEVARLSALSVAVVIALLGFVYRSVTTLALGLVPVLSGVLAGVAAVSLGFGTVHGLTLGFGTTLIGESIDYAIYLFAQARPAVSAHRQRERQRWAAGFWPTVRLGVLTSVCGFASLLLSGFPGLAQLGLFSIAGLCAAALVTRFVLPELIPARLRIRELQPLGERLARLAAVAPRWRWPAAALVAGACAAVVWSSMAQRDPLWSRELASLSPVPPATQALDAMLRADLGAPDVRHLIVVRADSQQAALQGAERIAAQLDPLVARQVLAGYENPARFLPSEAAQRARLAALPPADALRERLDAAVAGLPVKPALFAPFVADVEAARAQPPLRRDDLQGTSFALAVDALLTQRDGAWQATLPLRMGSESQADTATGQIRAALARAAVPGALLVDLKRESDQLYAGYLGEALRLSLGGALAIAVVLAVGLRSPRRALATLLPLAAAMVVVIAALALAGRELSLLHLVGLLLLVAVGSNYALFFGASAADGSGPPAPRTLASLMLANATTVAAFGLLGLSHLPLLQAFGQTVGPGAILALVFAAIFAPRHGAVGTDQEDRP